MFSEAPLSKNSFSHLITGKKHSRRDYKKRIGCLRNARFSFLFGNKFLFEGSSVARLPSNKCMKIELLSGSVVSFWQLLQPHFRRTRAPRAAVCVLPQLQAHSRAKVEQSSESKGSAPIRRQLMIMATASLGVRPHTGQPQCAICESTLAPGCTVAQHHLRLLLPRDKPANSCLGEPAKEKKQPLNSSLSDRSRENSRCPQGTPPVSAQVRRARAPQAHKRAANAQL